MIITFPDNINDTIAQAERKNYELQLAEYEHLASQHNADATLRELWPQISAFASYNKQLDPQPGIVSDSQTQTIGLRATIALYQGGSTRSRIRESKHASKQREYQIDEINNRIRREVTSNWRSHQAAKKITEIRKEEIEAAELALQGVREESKMGQRTVLDILDADEEVINAKVALARATRNEAAIKFMLANSLGLLKTTPSKAPPLNR